MGALSAVGSPTFIYFIPTFGHGHNEQLLRREDGKYFYVLNSASNDVTVIQSSDGAITHHIPVDSSHYRLWRPDGGKYLFCLGGKELNIIDTETNLFLRPPASSRALQAQHHGLTSIV